MEMGSRQGNWICPCVRRKKNHLGGVRFGVIAYWGVEGDSFGDIYRRGCCEKGDFDWWKDKRDEENRRLSCGMGERKRGEWGFLSTKTLALALALGLLVVVGWLVVA